MRRTRICLVTDDEAWSDEAVRTLVGMRAAPEIVRWREAMGLRDPTGAIVAHVDRRPSRLAECLDLWAKHAWQPGTVFFLKPVPESGALVHRLDELRYPRVHYLTSGGDPGRALADAVRPVLERRLWIVGIFARHVACTYPDFLEVLTTAVDSDVPCRRVSDWVRRCKAKPTLGIVTLTDLERFMRRRGVDSPKALLDRLRLTRVVAHARSTRPQTRDQLARRFGYGSGDFLGRKARRLSGSSFGELCRLEIQQAVSLLAG